MGVATVPAVRARLMASLDLLVFALTVLPAGLYLVVGEAHPRQAAWGKRRAGLRVVTADGQRPGVRRIVLRIAVKLLP